MVAIKNTLALTALATAVSAQNPIVASIINDVVAGIAAAKTDSDISDEAATSEIQSVVGIIQQNTDVQNLVSQVIPIAAMGLNDDNFPKVLEAAHATLGAFQASPEYPEAVKGLKDVLPHYDVQQALGNVQDNLSNVLALVTPSLPTLTPNHSEAWESATKNVQALAASLGFLPGDKQAEATSAEASKSGEASKTEESSASKTEEASASKTEEASKTESKAEETSKAAESKSESKAESKTESKAESKAEETSKAESKTEESSKAAESTKAESSKAAESKATSVSASATGAAAASASASTSVEQGNGAVSYNLALGGVVGAAAMVVALL